MPLHTQSKESRWLVGTGGFIKPRNMPGVGHRVEAISGIVDPLPANTSKWGLFSPFGVDYSQYGGNTNILLLPPGNSEMFTVYVVRTLA
jgi:hypothetical protein